MEQPRRNINPILLCGDASTILRTLPSNSIHSCITSPPFFGLRDYGTGTWQGGDPLCDHAKNYTHVSNKSTLYSRGEYIPGAAARKHGKKIAHQYRTNCEKCGAKRMDAQVGLESTPEEYVARLVDIFGELRRVLRDDATLWLNLGDGFWNSTHGKHPSIKDKDLIGIPWLTALALRSDGWYLRADNIWDKPNAMPESAKDRTTISHEYMFLLAKSKRYFYDNLAIKEDAIVTPKPRNKRSVWRINAVTKPHDDLHVAVFPEHLVEPCLLSGTSSGGCCPSCGTPYRRTTDNWMPMCNCATNYPPSPCTVIDIFCGSGTTGVVAAKHNRNFIGIDLHPPYLDAAAKRIFGVLGNTKGGEEGAWSDLEEV